jgi:hypothetical protein
LAFTKKLPAGRRTAEALVFKTTKAKSLDSRFRGNDERESKS